MNLVILSSHLIASLLSQFPGSVCFGNLPLVSYLSGDIGGNIWQIQVRTTEISRTSVAISLLL